MPVRGNTVLPSKDTNTPPVPESAHVLLTPDSFDIPQRRCFTPSELAHYFMTDAASIIRLIEDGSLGALPFRITFDRHGQRRVTWKIPYRAVAEYFARMQGAMN